MLGKAAQEHLVVNDQSPTATSPGDNRAVGDGCGFVRHDQVGVDDQFCAEAEARLAGAVRRVEREMPGREFAVADAAMRTGVLTAEQPVAGEQRAATPLQRGLD